RKADLDLLEAHADQRLEHAALALGLHGIDQGLVAVAQVHRAPPRRLGQLLVRPRPVVQLHRDERTVLVERHALRCHGRWRHLLAPLGFLSLKTRNLPARSGAGGLGERARSALAVIAVAAPGTASTSCREWCQQTPSLSIRDRGS